MLHGQVHTAIQEVGRDSPELSPRAAAKETVDRAGGEAGTTDVGELVSCTPGLGHGTARFCDGRKISVQDIDLGARAE